MPIEVDIKQLDDGSGIEATLAKHHAGWHKSCRLKFSQTKLKRLKKQQSVEKVSASPSVNTRSCHRPTDLKDDSCFLCNKPGGPDSLHNASTYNIDAKVRKCAIALNDTALLAKLEPGDMIALEAKYHRKCLVNLYNKARALDRAAQVEDCEAQLHGIALA